MRTFISALAVVVAGSLVSDAAAEQSKAASIQGVWQAVEVTIPGTSARTITSPNRGPT